MNNFNPELNSHSSFCRREVITGFDKSAVEVCAQRADELCEMKLISLDNDSSFPLDKFGIFFQLLHSLAPFVLEWKHLTSNQI